MKARALVDIPSSDIKSGEFFEADDAIVRGLVDGGLADDKADEAAVYGAEVPPAKVLDTPVPGIAGLTADAQADAKKGKK